MKNITSIVLWHTNATQHKRYAHYKMTNSIETICSLRFWIRPIHLALLLAIVSVEDNRKQFKESLISHVIYLLLFRTSIVCAFFMRVCVCDFFVGFT